MPELTTSQRAWRRQAGNVSLPEVHRSVVVPVTASSWRKLFAFSGPGFLVAVGYMDPGNWATDLSGGARFGYALLMVVMISNFMAILLQHLCIKLGVATGRDLDAEMLQQDRHEIRNRSEEHTSELQSLRHLVCRRMLQKKRQQR